MFSFLNWGRFEKGWGPVLSNRNPLICMQYLKMSVCKSLVYKWRFLKWTSTYYLFQCAIFRRRLERTEESSSVNIFNSRGPGGQGVFSKNINIELMKLHLVVALQLILKFDWQMSVSKGRQKFLCLRKNHNLLLYHQRCFTLPGSHNNWQCFASKYKIQISFFFLIDW